MTESLPYIAGVGWTSWSRARSWLPPLRTADATRQLAISAGTKALLDAGITYDDVDYAISGGDISGQNDVFYVFGRTSVPMYGVEEGAGVYASTSLIRQGKKNCILVLDVDKFGATGIVMVSEAFLWRHPYLKDTAVVVRGCARRTPGKTSTSTSFAIQEALHQAQFRASDFQVVESNDAAAIRADGVASVVHRDLSSPSSSSICEIVWLLRGWKSSATPVRNCLHCVVAPNGTTTVTALARADEKEAPKSEDAKHKNDGKDRLGGNPVTEERDISFEDWEAVKARPEFSEDKVAERIRFRRKGGDRAALAKL